MPLPTLLIVCNTPSKNTKLLCQAVVGGATTAVSSEQLRVVVKEPLDTNSDDVKNCQAIIIGTTENFGAMSGLIKDFFERIYYECLEHTQALPFALYVRAGLDGQGTLEGVQRITTGLKWKIAQQPLLLHGDFLHDFESQCEELGATMAVALEAGVI